ncbi:PAS domain-containing protein [Candidatus Omnitrophota bacterium]
MAELEKSQSEQKKTGSAVAMTDMVGRLIYVNDACLNMQGYKHKSETIGKYLPEFWHGKRLAQSLKNLAEKGADSGEDVGRRKDGLLFNVAFTAQVVKDEEGKLVAMPGSFIDITECKKREDSPKKILE